MGAIKKIDKNADPSSYQINSNVSTTFTLLNSMIGGTILLLPIYFSNVGYISSSLVIFVTGMMCYKGADIYVQHLKKDEFDSQETIHRILGNKWRNFFVVISTINMFFGCLVYYDFSLDMLYSIIIFILKKCGFTEGEQFAPLQQVSFDRFSVQYLSLITFPIFLAVVFIQNFKFLVKLAEFGVYSIYSYIVFIFYNIITNITSGRLQNNTNEIKLFSFDIGTLGCTASSAFSIHNSVCQIVKCNKDQTKKRSIIKATYIFGALIYLCIGIIGALGVVGRTSQTGSAALIISDYYSLDDWEPLIVQILYFIHLVSMNPILFNICRTRLFEKLYPNNGGIPPMYMFIIVNVFFCIVCTLVKILHITPDLIINFNGAFSSFFIIYLIPSVLHLACYHGKNTFLRAIRKSLRHERELDTPLLEPVPDNETNNCQHTITNSEILMDDEETERENQKNNNLRDSHQRKSCNDHEDEIESVNKYVRYLVYCLIIFLGLGIFFYGMYSIFKKAFS